MTLFTSEAARRAFADASENRRELANRVTEVVEIADVDYTSRLTKLSFEATSDAPAVLYSATIAARLPEYGPRSPYGRDFVVTLVIEGDETTEEVVAFRGRVVEITTKGGYTSVKAATGGYGAKRSIKRELDYLEASPSIVLLDALSGLPYEGIEIPLIETPKITAAGSEAFRPLDTRASMIDVVREEARIACADSPLNIASAYSLASITGEGSAEGGAAEGGENGTPRFSIEEGVDCDYGAVTVEGSEVERFFAVCVYTEDAEGKQILRAKAEVDNHGIFVDPDDTLDLLFSEPTETGPTTDASSEYDLAFRESLKLSVAPVRITAPLIYRPHWLQRGDLVPVRTTEFIPAGEAPDDLTGVQPGSSPDGSGGAFVREYLVRVDDIRGGESRSDGEVSGEAERVGEWFARTEETQMTDTGIRALRGGMRSGAVVPALWGRDYAGRLRFSDSAPFIDATEEDENGVRFIRFDADVAARYGVEIERDGRNVKIEQ